MSGQVKKSKAKSSIADQIIQGLHSFTEALENDEDLEERFICRTMMHSFQAPSYAPAQVRKTRKLLGTNQRVFALLLGVSVRAVQAWEVGRQTPSGVARRFLDEIRRNPPYWIERIKEAAITR